MARGLTLAKFSAVFCNLFVIWVFISSALALSWPEFGGWPGPAQTFWGMTLLNFCCGVTTQLKDFREPLTRPRPMFLNLAACFCGVPILAILLVKVLGLPQDILVGMVLLGSVNGGSISNLCAQFAGADVPLSVLMTSTTTLAAPFATPFLCKVLLGTIVPVDALGILLSAVQVVLLPVFLGVVTNTLAPRICEVLRPIISMLSIVTCVILIGAIVARTSDSIRDAGLGLHCAVAGLHIIAGLTGYTLSAAAGDSERQRRTMALEVGLKNCGFAAVLATAHFEAAAVQAPAAVSCIWGPAAASAAAAIWKRRLALADQSGASGEWVASYNKA
eukprot:TRINITY_DN94616_c0_g1_i1.p1 TRINITY_DN94616_c0_g1~~TRINITY_DN94616_c0_g1_i1.p1  ORF type:complete len:332 (+),score=48.92 TRINITY_DN94616_c0_g1_i1:76-1071(+)